MLSGWILDLNGTIVTQGDDTGSYSNSPHRRWPWYRLGWNDGVSEIPWIQDIHQRYR